MANEISSQITSAVSNNKPTEPASKPASAGNVGNRQDVAASQQSTAAQASSTGPVKAAVEQAVSDINDYVQTVNRDLQFRVDDALPLGRSIVTVIDSDTQETIRQFPSEEALSLAHQLREQALEESEVKLEGLIISAQA
ncbi:MAG: flagellar protein FlaG [Sulfuriflexus sp.]|nr:flagellar protein FlaG [Sulfuriflexus sp.]